MRLIRFVVVSDSQCRITIELEGVSCNFEGDGGHYIHITQIKSNQALKAKTNFRKSGLLSVLSVSNER